MSSEGGYFDSLEEDQGQASLVFLAVALVLSWKDIGLLESNLFWSHSFLFCFIQDPVIAEETSEGAD